MGRGNMPEEYANDLLKEGILHVKSKELEDLLGT
jgi:hypothetical protein